LNRTSFLELLLKRLKTLMLTQLLAIIFLMNDLERGNTQEVTMK